MGLLAAAAALLIVLAFALLWLAGRQRRELGLPAGRIISSDTGAWEAVTKPLYDPEWGLTGKPDYLIATPAGPLPVEVKSRRAGPAPYDGHRLQVAAYCRLVEATSGQRPAYGVLRYADRTFAIDYTPALEAELRHALADLRACERQTDVARSHNQAARCARCGYRAVCPQKL